MLRCEGLRAVHFRGALAEIPAPAIGARIVGIAGVRFDPKRGDGFSTLRKTERNAPLAPVVSISYNAPRTHVNRGQYFKKIHVLMVARDPRTRKPIEAPKVSPKVAVFWRLKLFVSCWLLG